tara:strand:+ start:808 stop:951 length:144 start_codon:yes stop_codon:yes gene_type:complete
MSDTLLRETLSDRYVPKNGAKTINDLYEKVEEEELFDEFGNPIPLQD